MVNDERGTAEGVRIHEAVFRVHDARLEHFPEQDVLAEKTSVALECNGIAYATMLATPADLEDFALGFRSPRGSSRRRPRSTSSKSNRIRRA